ncbi:MAG: gamma-glutamyl-gamma-aminobutyrate hydrolase family protein [Fimbriimonadaceae bacterium]|nr:gamma-glutamyl-gamma-aminobutyrate hydrolase family protein [Fimbriimonadaceae bacterium]
MHGKASQIEHDGKGLFEGIPSPFQAIRYHSLAVLSDAVPPGYDVTARSKDDGEIMGIRHRTLPIEGVQFHPESIDSEHGMTMIRNFVLRCGLRSQV